MTDNFIPSIDTVGMISITAFFSSRVLPLEASVMESSMLYVPGLCLSVFQRSTAVPELEGSSREGDPLSGEAEPITRELPSVIFVLICRSAAVSPLFEISERTVTISCARYSFLSVSIDAAFTTGAFAVDCCDTPANAFSMAALEALRDFAWLIRGFSCSSAAAGPSDVNVEPSLRLVTRETFVVLSSRWGVSVLEGAPFSLVSGAAPSSPAAPAERSSCTKEASSISSMEGFTAWSVSPGSSPAPVSGSAGMPSSATSAPAAGTSSPALSWGKSTGRASIHENARRTRAVADGSSFHEPLLNWEETR